MKLHLPKLLLTAVLAVVGMASNVWADTPVYSGTVYTFAGNTSGTDLAFSILQYDNNGEAATIQGQSGNWGDISSAIATPAAGADRNTLKLGDGYIKGLTYSFNPIAVAGFIVDASGYSITTGSVGGNRNIEIGNTTATKAYTTINYDFSITNDARSDAYIKLIGTQEWNIASTATLTLNAGSASSVILGDGSKTTQNGGTVNLFGDSVTGTGSYIVNSGTLSNAVIASGATLGLGSTAVLDSVTMQSGSVLDLTALTLSTDTAAVSTTGVTLNSGLIVSLSNITEGETVKLFDSSVSGVSFIIDGKVIAEGRSKITEDSGSYTFTTLGGNLDDMTWAEGDGTWNTTNTNWNSTTAGNGIAFVNGDTATFSSSAAVIVDGGVSVSGMTVSGSTTELSLTRTNSGYIAGAVTVTDGAKLIIGSETGSTGFVRGDIEVADGTLQFDAKDVTGYGGRVNSTQNIKIASNSQLLLNHDSNEAFTGDIILNGIMKGTSESGAARWDLFGGSASLSVEAGNTATLENVVLQLRQNDSEITVAENATLTLEKGMSKGTEGNGKFKKLGNGALNIEGSIGVSGISVNGGSVTFSADGSTGDISMNADNTAIQFSATTDATAEAPTTYTVGDISTTTGNWFNRNITIDDKVQVNATSLTNSWGMGTLQVDGVLNLTGDLKLSTGVNTKGENNIISGTGSVTAASLTTGNVGNYTLSVKSLKATTSTIAKDTQVTGGEVELGSLTLSGKLVANGGKIIISSTTGGGTLTGTAGGIELKAGSHTVGTLDMSDNDAAQGILTLKEGAALAVTNSFWACNTATINLEQGASLTKGVVTLTGNATATPATIMSSENLAYSQSGANGEKYTISNATVTVNTGDAEVTLSNCLTNSILKNGGANTLTASNAANVLSGIDASTGNIDIINSQAQSVSTLSIGAGKTVGIYSGSSVPTDPTSADEATVTTSSLTVGTGATLNANLVLSNGATVTMADALTMGSTVTLGEGMTLAGDLVSTVQGLGEGVTATLFMGVDGLTLGSTSYDANATLELGTVQLGTYFSNVTNSDIYLGYDGDKVYAGVMQTPVTPAVPEPTTATLSLLALAALASRRRRK